MQKKIGKKDNKAKGKKGKKEKAKGKDKAVNEPVLKRGNKEEVTKKEINSFKKQISNSLRLLKRKQKKSKSKKEDLKPIIFEQLPEKVVVDDIKLEEAKPKIETIKKKQSSKAKKRSGKSKKKKIIKKNTGKKKVKAKKIKKPYKKASKKKKAKGKRRR